MGKLIIGLTAPVCTTCIATYVVSCRLLILFGLSTIDGWGEGQSVEGRGRSRRRSFRGVAILPLPCTSTLVYVYRHRQSGSFNLPATPARPGGWEEGDRQARSGQVSAREVPMKRYTLAFECCLHWLSAEYGVPG